MNRYSYALAGSLVAIISARTYVYSGMPLNFTFMNHAIHHLYYGIGLLILAGILKLKKIDLPGLIFFLIGAGLGFVADEADLLIFIGRSYTMQLYDSPINISMDILLLIGLGKLSAQEDRIHVSYEPEVAL